ncbi:MAG: hypothetical protein PHF86_04755 [Candidatus Nanoarchaeia archaeon]|nr:hypothetical protein [Candidatus Nanoarchaeia archaeon]
MADTKRKYVSEFEIESNIQEALDQLKKYYVEFSKMPNVVDSFNKSLKKNADLENKFISMMSAIPKTMKKLSELSKIELVPRKELEKLTDTIQLISSASKSLQGKTVFDAEEVKSIVNEFGKVTSELTNLESRHSKVIEKSEAYNRLIADSSRIHKNLVANADKFRMSTTDIASEYEKVRRQTKRISTELENAKNEGKISSSLLSDYDSKLKDVRDKVSNVNKEYDNMSNNIGTLTKDFDKVLSVSNDISGSMKNNIAKTSYQNVIKDIEELRDQLEMITDNTEKSSTIMNGQLSDIKSRLEENVEQLNLAVSADEKIVAETKTVNDAFNLLTKMTSEVYEEMQDISNIELRKQFEEANKRIQQMSNDLQRTILLENGSNQLIREKMGLLKNEEIRLRKIVNQQQEIKKLEESSISATVQRAREQNKVNQAYIRQVLSQRKNLGGLIDAMKVYKQNIPIQATAKFGETGLIAAKAMTGAFKVLGAVIAPFAGAFTFLGMVKTAFMLERQVKNARKQVLFMAADTHSAGKTFDEIRKGGVLAESSIEEMRKTTESWSWSLGVSMDQAIGYLENLRQSGFRADDSLKNLEDMMGIAASMGVEVSELASRSGVLRSEFGMNLSEIGTGFVQLQKDASNAGITTTIFFDKVVNAATGLGLYGKKVEDVSSLFSGLVKNMRLPEKAATDAATSIVGSFKDVSSEMQITTYRLGKGNKYWKKSFSEQTAAIDRQLKTEQDTGKRSSLLSKKRALQEMDQMKGLNAELMRARGLDPTSEFLMRMQAVAGKVGINIEGDIEKVDASMSKSFYKMEKIGEIFGISREAVMSMKRLSENLLANSKGLKTAFGEQDAKSMINVLSSVSDSDSRTSQLTEKLLKMQSKGKDLKEIKNSLIEQFPELSSDLSSAVDSQGNITAEGLAKVISKLDVNFKSLSTTQKQNVKEELKRQQKAAGLQALKQTKSTEDALNNTISKVLRNIFVLIEKFVNIFSFIFKDKLKGFEDLNESLSNNESVLGELNQRIRSKRSELEISEIETGLKADKGDETAKAQLDEIRKEQKILESISNKTDAYSKNQQAQRKELEANGKITDKYMSLVQKGNSIAADLAKSSIAEGLKFETPAVRKRKAVLGLGGGYQVGQSTKLTKEQIASKGPVKLTDEQMQQLSGKKIPSFGNGGIVPGTNFQGDKILSGLNSGELVLPKAIWKNIMPTDKILEAVSGKSSDFQTSRIEQTKNINDNRVINIHVNQNDRRQVEQIVLNALYTDKM